MIMKNVELCLLNLAGRLDEPVDAFLPLFAPGRREAILRFKFNPDRNRTVWAELMARAVAARRVGMDAADVVITRDGEGRPQCSVPGMFVSLSHSGPWAACCVGGTECGVDVETRARGAGLDIARRFFLPSEHLRLKSMAERGEDWESAFLRDWTIKESCLKCLGLNEWSGVDCEAVINGGGPIGGWNFVLPDGAVAGVCSAAGALPESIRILHVEEIKEGVGI